MLSLTRGEGQRVFLHLPNGDDVIVEVAEIDRGKVKLRFSAPRNVQIMREELLERERPEAAP